MTGWGAVFEIKSGDTRPVFEAICQDAGIPAPLTAASSARLVVRRGHPTAGPLLFARPVTIDADQVLRPGRVRYQWQASDTATPGVYLAEVEVTWLDGSIQTFPGDGYVRIVVLPDLD